MPYGKSKPNINETGIVQRKMERLKEAEFSGKIFDNEEFLEIGDELDEANLSATMAFYQDNPHLHPDYQEKPEISKREQKKQDGYILINQSLIKKLVNKYQEEEQFCPRNIKECVMNKKYKDVPTEAMMAGKFFESHCLGGTTGTEPVLDLPRKRVSKKREAELIAAGKPVLGEKTIDQVRLETQIERFKIKAKQLQTQIITGINTHVQVFKEWDKKYLLVGELDWFPTPIFYQGVLQLAMIDIKVTSNVESTFGKFCWGTPKYMDHLQADMYHYLVRNIDFELNPHLIDLITPEVDNLIKSERILFLYWVWGYQKEPLEYQEKFVERSYRDENGSMFRQSELKERIRKAIAIIEREESFGWGTNPVPDICKTCPLNIINGGNCTESTISIV